jgi:hypothetical protein
VFGNKNLTFAADGLPTTWSNIKCSGTTPDKKGAIDAYRIFSRCRPT